MLDVNLSTRINAISQLAQNAGCDYGAYNGEITTWTKGDKPTEAEIAAEITRLTAEFDAQAYARNRASEYPSQGDQNDMIYKDMLNSTTTHKDAVEAVKTKWPKDNSGPVE